jgi:hypothetical protein
MYDIRGTVPWKGQCHEIFASAFCHQSSSPKPLIMSLAPYRKNFEKLAEIFASQGSPPMSTTLVASWPPATHLEPRIFEKISMALLLFLGAWGKDDSWKKNLKQKISWHRSLFQGVPSLTVQIYLSLSNCFRILWTAPLYLGLFNFALWSRRNFLNFLNQIYIFHSRKFSRREKLPKYIRTTWEFSFVFIHSTASSAAPTLLLCWKMLGMNTEPEFVNV